MPCVRRALLEVSVLLLGRQHAQGVLPTQFSGRMVNRRALTVQVTLHHHLRLLLNWTVYVTRDFKFTTVRRVT